MTLIYKTTKTCRICTSLHLEEILNLGDQPPANSLYSPEDLSPPCVPLRLMFCTECKTLQIGESINPQYLFSEYVWVTGTSKTAVEHSRYFFQNSLSRSGKTKPYVVEIASNDGTFLKRFQDAGCLVLGVDPAKNIAKTATEGGIPTVAEFFNEDLAHQLVNEKGMADIVIARNVIPHVKEIHSVIEGISILLGQNSTGVIEFHDAGLILKELHYDSIYHEHLFYFSLNTICFLLNQHGLHVFDLVSSPISGGSWIIYFSKKNHPKSEAMKRIEEQETTTGLNKIESWIDFAEKTKQHKFQLQEMTYNQGGGILAYGASARSSTLLNYSEINHSHISAVIDKNPLKHGLLTPGSKIPIISFNQGLKKITEEDKILLLSWNFEEEIISDLRSQHYKGQFIIPLPNQPRLR
jgi:hypothetical protein